MRTVKRRCETVDTWQWRGETHGERRKERKKEGKKKGETRRINQGRNTERKESGVKRYKDKE